MVFKLSQEFRLQVGPLFYEQIFTKCGCQEMTLAFFAIPSRLTGRALISFG